MRTYDYKSGLASQITAFIQEKRSLGCKYERESRAFLELDRFLVEQNVLVPQFSQFVVERWIAKRPNEKRKNQRWRLNFTKRFVRYLQQKGYDAYYPTLTISAQDDHDFTPYIFSNAELAAILNYFENIPSSKQDPNGYIVLPMLFKTLICCGLRVGEATRLRVKDIDLEDGIIFIENAKHGKSRQVPISESLRMAYVDYYDRIHKHSIGEAFFFPNARGNSHHTTAIYNKFREALWHCGIQHKGRGYGPRVHDIRHTFAVRCMQKLSISKGDIVNSLPYLSVYLGHYNMGKTQHYLHLITDNHPELLQHECDYLADTIPTLEDM